MGKDEAIALRLLKKNREIREQIRKMEAEEELKDLSRR